jgi:hypothetical protein
MFQIYWEWPFGPTSKIEDPRLCANINGLRRIIVGNIKTLVTTEATRKGNSKTVMIATTNVSTIIKPISEA